MADVKKPKVEKTDQGFLEKAPAELGADQVQAKLDAEQEVGYVGENVDPTPDEVYALPNPGFGKGDQVAPELLGATKGRALAEATSRGLTADDLGRYQQDAAKQE
jgi:hypothetical protein